MNFFKSNKTIILQEITIIICLSILLIIVTNKEHKDKEVEPIIEESKEINISEDIKNIKVDIKGAVANPGVYELEEGSIVNDILTKSGGLLANASTKYLNLSKKLKDEMTIIIYTEEELSKEKETPKEECYCEDVIIKECEEQKQSIIISEKKNDNLISINTGSINDLMTLPSIGEAKAKAIIEYRTINGNFKELEEIKNVSGISDNIYEKIKQYIKL